MSTGRVLWIIWCCIWIAVWFSRAIHFMTPDALVCTLNQETAQAGLGSPLQGCQTNPIAAITCWVMAAASAGAIWIPVGKARKPKADRPEKPDLPKPPGYH